MSKRSGLYPHIRVDAAAVPAVAEAGGVLLARTARVSGLDRALSDALGRWRKPLARHDPAKVLLDLAVSLGLGGDACRDAALLRAEPGVYGPVAAPGPSASANSNAVSAPTANSLTATAHSSTPLDTYRSITPGPPDDRDRRQDSSRRPQQRNHGRASARRAPQRPPASSSANTRWLQRPTKFSPRAVLTRSFDAADLRGCVIAADAMHTQDDTAKAIVAAGADQALTLKANRSTTLAVCKKLP